MTHRFLRNERDLFPVFLDVVSVDRLAIKQNLTDNGVVKTLDQLNAIKQISGLVLVV